MNLIKTMTLLILYTVLSVFIGCTKGDSDFNVISEQELKDKIAGGWAGKMIGVVYGDPTEFRARSVIYEKDLHWEPGLVKGALSQDDLYVQMSFMMTMDKYGMDAPAEKFAGSFANAGYRLWHANRKARKNYWDGIMPPLSGSPKYSMHADDIDFQIEADYIGFMCPGMPQTSNKMCDKIGHIMNYGDGVYGGMFVCALYTTAYFENDIHEIIESALEAIPKESQYAKCINDVISGYERNPDDWRKTWQELQDKWGSNDICGAMDPFNIDAKINGAYIVMGLLYGEGDFQKTMEVSIRCGQDSDCNPSNAAGVLGILGGYSRIDNKWKSNIPDMADSLFIYTNYSFNLVVDKTLDYAKKLIVENGGRIDGEKLYIKVQPPVAPPLEQSFSDIIASYRTSNEDENWEWKGNWETYTYPYSGGREFNGKVSQSKNSECTISFNGTGFLLMGHWDQDGGKADIYLDGKKMQTIDTYYWVGGQGAGAGWLNGAHLYHVLGLSPGNHRLRVVATGDKNDKATGSKIYLERAIVYQPI
jgi:hypothetical protein